MLRKDHVMAEIQKLAEVLAKIMSLKQQSKVEDAHDLIKDTLISDFDNDENLLNTVSVKDFEALLKKKNYSEQKLDSLAQLIFESAHPFREEDLELINRLHLVLEIFNLLEKEHHTQSFENLAKREMIDKFLNNNQYE